MRYSPGWSAKPSGMPLGGRSALSDRCHPLRSTLSGRVVQLQIVGNQPLASGAYCVLRPRLCNLHRIRPRLAAPDSSPPCCQARRGLITDRPFRRALADVGRPGARSEIHRVNGRARRAEQHQRAALRGQPNGAWYSPPASLRSVLSAKTITASPGSSRWLGKVKVLVECSVRAST